MYFLSDKYRKEFQRTGIVMRLDFAHGLEKDSAALLIQVNTLLLKYLIQNCRIEFLVGCIHEKLIYIVRIWDDENPDCLWSFMEYEEEKTALLDMANNGALDIFLFNECSVCEAYKHIEFQKSQKLSELVFSSKFVDLNSQSQYKEIANSELDRLAKETDSSYYSEIISNEEKWLLNNSIYLTNSGRKSEISLNIRNEGNQQEQIALWITDNLVTNGVYHSPKIKTSNGSREFTDLFLVSEEGCFIFESKSLTIFKDKLPNRKILSKNVEKHIEKAIRQLKGTVRQLQIKTPIYENDLLTKINVNNIETIHCLIIISDLSTIDNTEIVSRKVLEDFVRETHAFLHVVDLNELTRIVQAAHMIVHHSKHISLIQAFAFYLIEREKTAIKQGRLDIQMLLKIQDEQ